ncbi:hypothetical protein [Pseudomonas sp. 3A(2025)]
MDLAGAVQRMSLMVDDREAIQPPLFLLFWVGAELSAVHFISQLCKKP